MSYSDKRSVIGNLSDSEDEPEVPNKRKRTISISDTIPCQQTTTYKNSNVLSEFDSTGGSLLKSFDRSANYKQPKIENDYLPTNLKQPKIENDLPTTSSFGAKLMKKMGHQDGKGLGRYGQGITAPINESNQKGRQGLGHEVKGNFDKKVESWDFEKDPVQALETPEWVSNQNIDPPTLDMLKSWRKIGKKKRILDDEHEFCSKEVLKNVLNCKSIFDNLDGRDMRQARSRSNPFESIASCFFQNRAAMKMANIDAVFDFQFTDPKYPNGRSKVESDEPLYFCDVCAGPGGFSEYVLWRKKWRSKGFGMTLKAENDWKLDDFLAGSAAYFETHYGEHGIEGDGDVTKPENLKEFERFVLEQTNQRGVHSFLADGGFSVEGNENIQEILSKQLYLCQFLCALSVLRTGGNFVCKIFDIFTPFSVGLVYLMYLCFDRICIHKPVTSRPANSERYIVCEGAQESRHNIKDYLHLINDNLNQYFRDNDSTSDVKHIVPLSMIKNDKTFYQYIKNSNERLGTIQCVNLQKIQVFVSSRNLYDTRQAELYEECLRYWKVPNKNRASYLGDQKPEKPRNRFQKQKLVYNPNLVNYNDLLNKFSYDHSNYQHKNDIHSIIRTNFRELDKSMWHENFKKCSIFDYKCTIGCGNLVLLLGCGGTVIYELELNSSLNCFGGFNNQNYNPDDWKKLDSKFKFELPRDTLLLAEKCVEYSGEDKTQKNSFSMHILDAYFIEGENMAIQENRVVPLDERNTNLSIFVKAITKKSRIEYSNLRIRELTSVENLEPYIIDNLLFKKPKNRIPFKYGITLPFNSDSGRYVYPSGIYFFKNVQSPWSIVLSRSKNKFYYYRSDTQTSTYDLPDDDSFYAPPKSYLQNGFIWRIKNEDIESDRSNEQDPQCLSKNELLQRINMLK